MLEKKKAIKQKWNTPTAGWLKFNLDGATRGKLGPTGIGGILRNKGELVLTFSQLEGERIKESRHPDH